jgi:hypothetical protein
MSDIKRLHYFNHQFLVESDFADEQQYHLAMRRRHNAALHDYGVADGLAVTRTGDREITVQPGLAIDRDGRELVLLDSRIVGLSDAAAFPAGATIHLTIAYDEAESDPSTATGVTGNTRIIERPQLVASTTAPAGGSLGRPSTTGSTNTASVPNRPPVRVFLVSTPMLTKMATAPARASPTPSILKTRPLPQKLPW